MRESFIFYKEYKKAVDEIKDKKKKLMFYECITDYVFYKIIPTNVDKDILAMFLLIKNKLDKVNKSYWNYEDRRSSKYKKWKASVLERDKNKCKICGAKEQLVVHHIKHFADNINERYNIDNGITLCENCHKEVHKNER